MQRMTKADENRLERATSDLIKAAASADPTECLVKVAGDHRLNADEIRRVGEAYNQSRTLFQLSKKSELEKLAEFPLAAPDAAVARVFPSEPKSAADRTKAAAMIATAERGIQGVNAWAPAPAPLQKSAAFQKTAAARWSDAVGDYRREINDVESQAREVQRQGEECALWFKRAADELRSDQYERARAKVERAFQIGKHAGQYNDAADAVMVAAFQAAGLPSTSVPKMAFDPSKFTLSDFDRGGYGTVENLVARSLLLHQAESKLAEAQKRAKAAGERAIETCKAAADEGGPLGGLGEALKFKAPDTSKAEQGMRMDLLDPDIRDQKMRMQGQLVLHALLHDPKSPLSKQDPHEVIRHFNEVVEASPNLLHSQAAMDAELRNRLFQGGQDLASISRANDLATALGDTYGGNVAAELTPGAARKA